MPGQRQSFVRIVYNPKGNGYYLILRMNGAEFTPKKPSEKGDPAMLLHFQCVRIAGYSDNRKSRAVF